MKTKILTVFLFVALLFTCRITFAAGASTAYTNDELCEMARQFCKARGDHVPAYFTVDHENGNTVTIHLFDVTGGHTATSDWYEIDRTTGKGMDFFGKAIDLSPYAPDEVTPNGLPFQDVNSSNPYYESVRYVYENGLFSGTSANEFSPNASVDRAMVVTVLYRLAGRPVQVTGSDFADVPSDAYYAQAVAWAVSRGVVNGTGVGMFSPQNAVTHEQAAVMLYNYGVLYSGMDSSVTTSLYQLRNGSQVSDYAKDAIVWCLSKGILTDISIIPKANASRAEIAAMLHRFNLLTQTEANDYR